MATLPIPQGAQLVPLNQQAGTVPIPQGATLQPLGQQQQPPEQPGFFTRLGQSLGIPTSQKEAQAMYQSLAPKSVSDAVNMITPGGVAGKLATGYGQTVFQGIKRNAQEQKEAAENIASGQPILPNLGKSAFGLTDAYTSALPAIGPSMQTAGQDVAQKNYAGAAGGLTGVIGQVVAPELANKIPPNSLLGRALLLGRTPEGAYADSLKPSTTMSQADRANVINTGLQEGIPVSKGGLEDIGNRIQSLNQQIANVIAADPTRPIDPRAALQNLGQVRQRFTNQVNPRADLAAINASGEEFAENQHIPPEGAEGPIQPMNAADAQAMKQGTYQALGDKAYGEVGSASKEAQKALARGLKEELAQQFPELNDLNARDGRLIDLQNSLERAVARIQNRRVVGIDAPIVAAAAKAMTNSNGIASAAGFMKAVLDYPGIQSRLAIALSQGKIPSPLVIPKIAAYSGSLQRLSSPGLQFLQSQQQPAANSAQSPGR